MLLLLLSLSAAPTPNAAMPSGGNFPAVAAAPASRPIATMVAGRVTTDAGVPLPGVVVGVQGSTQATSTNSSGEFLLQLTNDKSVLLFRYQGYRDQNLEVVAGEPLMVKMYPVTSSLSTATSSVQPEVLNHSEELPAFPGGDAAYSAFIRQNAVFPKEALARRISGTVYVSFVVDEQGRITDARVIKGCGGGLDEEALRLVRIMPWWTPGKEGGKPVRVARTIPVPFLYKQ
ncbi:TonB family protein [Hymenobacter sediminis]|uniref:TonB family protein n=1 Tax=Hymenobacter sediminis TaxID=2218621 RepID=UPI000DA648D7|nr:TonB family protein [Hymenobacter sediminis]RPD49636.1 TonB family protein [Hymenobacter sediminis]